LLFGVARGVAQLRFDLTRGVAQLGMCERISSVWCRHRSQEMGRFVPRDYLAHLPAVTAPHWPKFEPLDETRYSVAAPSGSEEADVAAWERAIANAQAQLEHTLLREVNLDLMAKFAPGTWRQHCESVDALVSLYVQCVQCTCCAVQRCVALRCSRERCACVRGVGAA
jgi:hypothetical protein